MEEGGTLPRSFIGLLGEDGEIRGVDSRDLENMPAHTGCNWYGSSWISALNVV